MSELIQDLFDIYESELGTSEIIPWSSPIPVFGNFKKSQVGTLGINPSNREFTCAKNKELEGDLRRFPTLNSLGLKNWNEATANEWSRILDSCINYFFRASYDLWFKKLDSIISGTGCSFYKSSSPACHFDLVPWATSQKWSFLNGRVRKNLIQSGAKFLERAINNSEVSLLVLNGKSVFDGLCQIAEVEVKVDRMPQWTLPRKSNEGVVGYSFEGKISSIAGVQLNRDIYILGYNHNIQSSFGVTREIQDSIECWIAARYKSL